jgi:hypothetical protein
VHGEDIAAAMSSRQFATTMRLVYRRASAIVANSRNTARMVASLDWHRHDVHVVYPGVDANRFHPSADDGSLRSRLAPRGELVLLSVARLQRRKGHDLVLRALPDLITAVPNVRYVIVGAGSERESLQRAVAALALTDVVVFEGEVPDEMLAAYFAACDIFVLPTRVEPHDFEGFGIVYLEAAAAAKPTIGGRNGGVPEAIADGDTVCWSVATIRRNSRVRFGCSAKTADRASGSAWRGARVCSATSRGSAPPARWRQSTRRSRGPARQRGSSICSGSGTTALESFDDVGRELRVDQPLESMRAVEVNYAHLVRDRLHRRLEVDVAIWR